MSNKHSKVTMVENILWVIFCLLIDMIAIALKPTVYGYIFIGAPLQSGTGIVMSYYFLMKGDLTAFRLKKQAKRFALQIMPIPLVTTGMFIFLSYKHNFPKLDSFKDIGEAAGLDVAKNSTKTTQTSSTVKNKLRQAA